MGAPKGNQYAKGLTKDVCPSNGRPRKEINADIVYEMASHDATMEEICAVLNIDHSTIYDRKDLSQALIDGRKAGCNSVKSAMFKLGVEDKHPGILIWLSKVRCGYKEQTDTSNKELVEQLVKALNNSQGIGECKST
jgi:hypothetical protein